MPGKKGKLIHYIDRTQKQVVDILERLTDDNENIKELIVFYMDKEGVYHSLSSDIGDEIYWLGEPGRLFRLVSHNLKETKRQGTGDPPP